ncbi:MAG TPA: class I adenylate-forming enzyme family protein [Candidatus Saccharimonadales bacterium]|nr:class I adenylate-forming enzyme family protein [Candidatus Saccharimonadales bacterium]
MSHITDYLRLHADGKADQAAIIFENKTITWAELWQQVEQTSFYFTEKLGAKDQQVVNLLMTNSIDFVVVYLAVLQAGHIALPMDPAYKKLEIDALIQRIPPSMVVTEERYLPNIGSHTQPVILAAELLKQWRPAGEPLRLSAKKQIASLTFTSGTSGSPKTVPNTHSNHIWNIKTCSKVWNWTSQDSLLLNLPLSHMHGLVMGLSGIIYHGNTLFLHQQSFDAKVILEALSSGKISMFTHVPLAYMKMLQAPGDYDLSAVRLCISGAAPLPPPVWHEFKDRFGIEILETYGSTETGRIAGNRLGKRVLGSPGKVLPGVDLKLSADSEVLVKSGGVFPGYWHNAKATKESLTDDGYWRTGDIAELKNGYVFLKGRKQEKIRRFGYSISPRDIEWAMHKNPAVKEIYVMGVQTQQADDELIYFIVTDLTDQQIEEYCKQNLLFAWRPSRIIRLPEIPRTRSGKPMMGTLKEMVAS